MSYNPGGGGGGGVLALPFGTHFVNFNTDVGLRWGAYTGSAIAATPDPTNFPFPLTPALRLDDVSYGFVNNSGGLTFSPAEDVTIVGWGSTFTIPALSPGVGVIAVGANITPNVLANLRAQIGGGGLGVSGFLMMTWWCTVL